MEAMADARSNSGRHKKSGSRSGKGIAEVEDEEDDDEGFEVSLSTAADGAAGSSGAGGRGGAGSSGLGGSMLFGPAIDPVLWRQETDRVAAKLSAALRSIIDQNSSSASAWAAHIDALSSFAQQQRQQQQVSNEGSLRSKNPATSGWTVAQLSEELVQMRNNIHASLTKIRQSEQQLSKQASNGAGANSALQYSTLKEVSVFYVNQNLTCGA
jgi:hypothetical protein